LRGNDSKETLFFTEHTDSTVFREFWDGFEF
jgi:hypothetical protein